MYKNRYNTILMMFIAWCCICLQSTNIHCCPFYSLDRYADIKTRILLPQSTNFSVSVDFDGKQDNSGDVYFSNSRNCKNYLEENRNFSNFTLYSSMRRNKIKLTIKHEMTDENNEIILRNSKTKKQHDDEGNPYKIRLFKKFAFKNELLYIVIYNEETKYEDLEGMGIMMHLQHQYEKQKEELDRMLKPIRDYDDIFFSGDNLYTLYNTSLRNEDPIERSMKESPLYEIDPTRILYDAIIVGKDDEDDAIESTLIETVEDFMKGFGREVKIRDAEYFNKSRNKATETNNQDQDDKDSKISKLEAELHDMKNMMTKMMGMMTYMQPYGQQASIQNHASHQQSLKSSNQVKNNNIESSQQGESQRDSDVGQKVNSKDHSYSFNQSKNPIIQSSSNVISSPNIATYSVTDSLWQSTK